MSTTSCMPRCWLRVISCSSPAHTIMHISSTSCVFVLSPRTPSAHVPRAKPGSSSQQTSLNGSTWAIAERRDGTLWVTSAGRSSASPVAPNDIRA